MSIQILKGNLLAMADKGMFDIIAHGCNCQNIMGGGIALQIARKWPDVLLTDKEYKNTFKESYNMMGTYSEYITKVGNTIDELGEEGQWLSILNLYTQMWPGQPSPGCSIPFDYNAFRLVLRKINYHFAGKSIGVPYIGCGLADADQGLVEDSFKVHLKDMSVTIVEYNGQTTGKVARGGQELWGNPKEGVTKLIGTAGIDGIAEKPKEKFYFGGGVDEKYGKGQVADIFKKWDKDIDERPLDWK